MGTNPAMTPEGRVEIERAMLTVNAPRLVKVIVVELDAPTGTMKAAGLAVIVKSLTTRLVVPELVVWLASPP